MSEFETESHDAEAPLDDEAPDARLAPDPDVDPKPGLDAGEVDADAEAAEADQLDQAWEVVLDDEFDED